MSPDRPDGDAMTAVDDELPGERTTVDGRVMEDAQWEERTVDQRSKRPEANGPAPPTAASLPPLPAVLPAPPVATASQPTAPAPIALDAPRRPQKVDDPDSDPGEPLSDADLEPVSTRVAQLAQLPTVVAPVANRAARLVCSRGHDRGREFALKAQRTSIGRGTDNMIILTDTTVSRHHCIVEILASGSFRLFDVRSGNGTLVNGVDLKDEAILRAGDELELGHTVLRFEQQAEAQRKDGTPPPEKRTMAMPELPLTPPNSGEVPLLPQDAVSPYPFPQAAMGMYPAYDGMPYPYSPSVPSRWTWRNALTGERRIMVLGTGAVILAILAGTLALTVGRRGNRTQARATPPTPVAVTQLDPAPGAPGKQPTAVPILVPAPLPSAASAKPAPPGPVAASSAAPMPVVTSIRPAPAPAKSAVAKTPPREPSETRPETAPPTRGPTQAERTALALYRERKFEPATQTLRAAADGDHVNADRLNTLAHDYAAVGAGLARGDAQAETSPVGAMIAYQDALGADQRSGKGAHSGYLRTQLAKVTPRAAQVYLQANRFELARSTCDMAADYGAGGDALVVQVRGQLEAKAKELYTQAHGVERQRPDEAQALYRRVMKMVPTGSTWYSKAYASLNGKGD